MKLLKKERELLILLRRGWKLVHNAGPYKNVILYKKREIEFDGDTFVRLKNKNILEHDFCGWSGVHWKLTEFSKSIVVA